MRNSPRSFAEAPRVTEEPVDSTTICAPATRAALASCTSPRSVPFGFCARSNEGGTNKRRNIERITTQFSEFALRIAYDQHLSSMNHPATARIALLRNRCKNNGSDLSRYIERICTQFSEFALRIAYDQHLSSMNQPSTARIALWRNRWTRNG